MLIRIRKVKGRNAIVTPLSGSEKPHADLWLIGPRHDGRISSLVGLYPIISALDSCLKEADQRGKRSRQRRDATPFLVVRSSGARLRIQ